MLFYSSDDADGCKILILTGAQPVAKTPSALVLRKQSCIVWFIMFVLKSEARSPGKRSQEPGKAKPGPRDADL